MTTEIRQIVRPLDPQAVVEAHVKATTGVHGVGDSEVESKAGAQAKADAVQANLDAHTGNTNNPHSVTAAQVGAVAKTGDTMTGLLQVSRSEAAVQVAVFENANGRFRLIPYSDGYDYIQSQQKLKFTAINAADLAEVYFKAASVVVLGYRVWHAGNDGAGSGLNADMLDGYHASYFQPASDERLKADIQPLADALAKVLSLRGVSFVWNDKAQEVGANRQTLAGREIGLLAGEVAQLVPEVVLDWIETPDGEKYKTVDSARLVALLVEAIKELNAKVEDLQARVAGLQ